MKTERLVLRPDEEARALIKRGAELTGKTVSEFIRDAAVNHAKFIIQLEPFIKSQDNPRRLDEHSTRT